jgi:hypothetical protein
MSPPLLARNFDKGCKGFMSAFEMRVMSRENREMHRLLVAAAAALSIAAASSLFASPAAAMSLPGAAGLGAAAQNELVQDVRTICRPVWNGWRWVQSCYWVPGPRYYGYGYYGPRRHHWHHHHHRRHHHFY